MKVTLLSGNALVGTRQGQSHYNVFGHSAIDINNKTFSYGTNWSKGQGLDKRDWGVSKSSYLDPQKDLRSTSESDISLTPEQEKQLQEYLEKNAPDIKDYKAKNNNCATVIEQALKAIGYDIDLKLNTPAELRTKVTLKEGLKTIATTFKDMFKKIADAFKKKDDNKDKNDIKGNK